MTDWTRDMVEERIVEAADVLRQLPGLPAQRLLQHLAGDPAQPQGIGACDADTDAAAATEALGDQPHGGDDHLEPYLEPEEAHLMWARAEGMPWKHICHRFGISRPTAYRRYDYALSVIAWRLNGRSVHHRRGRRFVVARAD